MTTLKRVSAWVDDEVKEAFIKAAKAQKNTESGLLGLLIDTFLNRNAALVEASGAEVPSDAKTDRVTVRFTQAEGCYLRKLADARGLKRSAYLGGLFRAHGSGKPYFTDGEMGSLREANRQLAAVAHSVTQIAQALHRSGSHSGVAMPGELAQMKDLVDSHRREVKALIRANLNSWSQPHDD